MSKEGERGGDVSLRFAVPGADDDDVKAATKVIREGLRTWIDEASASELVELSRLAERLETQRGKSWIDWLAEAAARR